MVFAAVFRNFTTKICLVLHSCYAINYLLFMPVKRGLLLPDLKEKSGDFLHRNILHLNFLCQYSVRYTRESLPLHPPIRRIFSSLKISKPLCKSPYSLTTVCVDSPETAQKTWSPCFQYHLNKKGGVKVSSVKSCEIACKTSKNIILKFNSASAYIL